MKPIKCAIIGCGPGTEGKGGVHSISYAHAWAFVGDPRTQLVAAASRTPNNREAFASEFSGTTMYADYREMLTHEKADLVSICGFPQDREAMLSAALEAGARILWVEKPFALSLGEGKRMQAAARAAGARIFVNHQRRMGKVFEWFRAAVSSGKLGSLYSVEVVQTGFVRTAPPRADPVNATSKASVRNSIHRMAGPRLSVDGCRSFRR